MKTLLFDMDGTLFDLYHYKNWLDNLEKEKPNMFNNLPLMVDLKRLERILRELRETKNYRFGIISWLPKKSTKEYCDIVKREKEECLEKYLKKWLEKDYIFFLPYGTPKSSVVSNSIKNCILVDDDLKVREEFEKSGGVVINANINLLEQLELLLN